MGKKAFIESAQRLTVIKGREKERRQRITSLIYEPFILKSRIYKSPVLKLHEPQRDANARDAVYRFLGENLETGRVLFSREKTAGMQMRY